MGTKRASLIVKSVKEYRISYVKLTVSFFSVFLLFPRLLKVSGLPPSLGLAEGGNTPWGSPACCRDSPHLCSQQGWGLLLGRREAGPEGGGPPERPFLERGLAP